MKRFSKETFKRLISVLSLLLVLSLMMNVPVCLNADTVNEEVEGNSEVILDKTASMNDDGTITLSIETYLTGEVVITETEVEQPADVVLVLDRSSSMRDSFGSGSGTTKSTALENAVNNFINSAAARYGADTNHRMAIVTFNNSASTLIGWNDLNSAGATRLKNAVAGISYSGDTNPAAGFNQAATLFSSSGGGSDRRKVVILFTDGYPADSGDNYTQSYAENGVRAAKTLKDSGVLIFTVGIFDDADANGYYGSYDALKNAGFDISNVGARGGNRNCEVYDYAETDAVDSTWYLESNSDNYVILANRFLSFASSNFPTASTMGVEAARVSHTWTWQGLIFPRSRTDTYYGYKITDAPKKEGSSFCLVASDAAGLSAAFSAISVIIQRTGTTIQLGKEAVVKDIISDYFELPKSATTEDINVYTADCIGKSGDTFLFEEREDWEKLEDVTVTISSYDETVGDRRNVSVSGFDFSANCVAYDEDAKEAVGKKMIIEFVIKPIDGFSGGNNIPTNNPQSGIYPSPTSEPVEKYPEPEVCIEILEEEAKMEFEDHVVYAGNSVCLDPVVAMRLRERDPIKDAFNTRTVYLDLDGDGNYDELTSSFMEITDTTVFPKYSVKIVVAPTETEKNENADGALATEKVYYNESAFTVYALKPSFAVTAQDTTGFYATSYTLGTGANADFTITWAEDNKLKTVADLDDGQEPTITKEDLKIDYVAIGFTNGAGTLGKQDLSVGMQLVSAEDDTPVNASAVTYSTTCSHGCTPATRSDGTYKVHVSTCSLTVENKGGKDDETFLYRVYRNGNLYTSLSLPGGSAAHSVVLKELPLGTYTVVPVASWDWRYTTSFPDDINYTTLSTTQTTGKITATNTSKESTLNGATSGVKVNTRS